MQTNELISNPDQQISSPQPTNTPIPQQQPSDVSSSVQESAQGKKSNKWLIIGLGVFALVALGIAGVFAYQNYQLKKQVEKPSPSSEVLPINTISTPTPTPSLEDETAAWKTFRIGDITLKYPPEWVIREEDLLISELPFTPGEQDRNKTYNIIETHKYPEQLYVGYTNQQWFERIYTLKPNESISDQREKRTKIISGKIASGEPYAIFKSEPSESFEGGNFDQVKAYILKGQIIYRLTLSQYNSEGLEIFKKIVSNAIIS